MRCWGNGSPGLCRWRPEAFFGMGDLSRMWSKAFLSSIRDLLSYFSHGRPHTVIISGNLGRGHLHSERRATCFNCTLVTSFLQAYRSELDESGF